MSDKKSVTVTFDSNVWENIVDPDKRCGIYLDLFELIENKKITPLFFAGLAIFETIPKNMRRQYIANYKMHYELNYGEEIIQNQGTKPYQLSEYLKKHLGTAFDLGFKFIDFPRVGAHKIPKEYCTNLLPYSLEIKHSKMTDCKRFIENELQAGYKYFKNLLDVNNG